MEHGTIQDQLDGRNRGEFRHTIPPSRLREGRPVRPGREEAKKASTARVVRDQPEAPASV